MKKFFLFIMLFSAELSCKANDYIFLPSFSSSERYEDNLRLQPNKVPVNFVTTLSPSLKFGYLLDNGNLEGNFKINQLLYDNESALDATENILNGSYSFNSERFSFSLTGNHAVQSSLTTELTAAGSGILVNANVLRTSRSISPTFNLKLSENNSLSLSYFFSDASFENRPNVVRNNLIGFNNQQFSSSILHSISSRQSINLSGSYSLFDAPQTRQSSSTITIQLGWQYLLNEKTQLGLTIGTRSTNTKLAGGLLQNTTNGQIYSVYLNRTTEWGNLNLSAGQQVTPASTGAQQQVTTLNASSTYNINEYWYTTLSGSYLQSKSIGNANNGRTFSSITPSINWRWTPEINIGLSYTYRQQNSTNSDAVGNTINFGFSYQPQVNKQVE